MRKIFGGVLLATAVAAGGSVDAEPGPIGKWLMNTPVTLWDRGMDTIEEVVGDLYYLSEPDDTGGRTIRQIAWARYDWDSNEINIHFTRTHAYASYMGTPATHEGCNTARKQLIYLLMNLPAVTEPSYFDRAYPDEVKAGLSADEILSKRRIPEEVSSWFNNNGFQKGGRDKELGAKLARIIFVEVQILGEDSRIECRDRITSLDAPSKPFN